MPDNALGHAGELAMRDRYPTRYRWDENNLRAMMRPAITEPLARFIEAQPMFFIATASSDGHCDASFRGCETDSSGRPLPAIRVIGPNHLVFPDFSGNGLYNSLGNIAVNPHVGMLFIDFETQRRCRVNGIAKIERAGAEIKKVWPLAQAVVVVTVEQAFGNCQSRIPQMRFV
ncbi:predicted pyridoxamine 5'-phosphate oxidase [Fulvimarina pelagi HTCC2506]|uniref:Predicted pyridoxamine 5'-phosphate oxidase n=1 Tax=Fulvimarina pelagi HTCC2506 TaxID=314231 RepID=Q0G3G7_9HYPH|nr:predicted pyridoxamine 5'-phosphate oxidase [Fulvimarina pelagi HTCC2506]